MMVRRKRFWFLGLVLIVLLGGAAWLQRDWLFARAYIALLEWDWRVQRLQVERVTGVLGVMPGQKVADIGAGSGIFSMTLAKAVGPEGIVYAVDVNQQLLDYIKKSARQEGIDNVRTIMASEDDPNLPEPVDLVFMCDTLHHISGRAEYLKNLRSDLKPGGRIAVIDFIDSPHLFSSAKYSLSELEFWLTEAGYQPAGQYTFLQNNFFVIYTCPTCPETQTKP